jgi:hypothetical protein
MQTIDEDTRLKALALAFTANDLYRQACQFDMAMQRLLGMKAEYFGEGQLGDLIYDGVKPLSVVAFDEALKGDGYEVEPAPKSSAA